MKYQLVVSSVSPGTTVERMWRTSCPPGPIMSPPLAPADSNDPFGRGVNFDLDLENVFCDAAVLPSLVTPLEDTEATVAGTAATYDPPPPPPWSPSGRPH